jgi:hypothetical protein
VTRKHRVVLPLPQKPDWEGQAFPGPGEKPAICIVDAHSQAEADWIRDFWSRWDLKLKETAARHPGALADWFHGKYLFWCWVETGRMKGAASDETAD